MPAAFPVVSTLLHYVLWPTKIHCRNTLLSVQNHYSRSSNTVMLCSFCVGQQMWNQLATCLVIFKIPYNHKQRVVLVFNSTDWERTVWPLSSRISYRIHKVSSRSVTVWDYSRLGISSTFCMPIWSTWSLSTTIVFDIQYPSGYEFQQADTLHLTALWTCIHRFTTWYAIYKLHCNIVHQSTAPSYISVCQCVHWVKHAAAPFILPQKCCKQGFSWMCVISKTLWFPFIHNTEQTTTLYPIHHFELVLKSSDEQCYTTVLLARAWVLVTESYFHLRCDAMYPTDWGRVDLCNDGTNRRLHSVFIQHCSYLSWFYWKQLSAFNCAHFGIVHP